MVLTYMRAAATDWIRIWMIAKDAAKHLPPDYLGIVS
jgi:hypothetical protein